MKVKKQKDAKFEIQNMSTPIKNYISNIFCWSIRFKVWLLKWKFWSFKSTQSILMVLFFHLYLKWYLKKSNLLQIFSDIFESWSFAWLITPTLRHQRIQSRWAPIRQCKSFSVFKFPNHFIVLNTLKRFHAQHQYFPHTHSYNISNNTTVIIALCKLRNRSTNQWDFLTKHPNVRGSSKSPKINTLWSHPLDGQFAFACRVITLVFHPATQTKIRKFDTIMSGH